MAHGCTPTFPRATSHAHESDPNKRHAALDPISKHQPTSRTRTRSVSPFAEPLIAKHAAEIGTAENTARSQERTVPHLSGDCAGIVGVDIHPLTTTVTLARPDMRLVSQETMSTHDNPQQFIDGLSRRVRSLATSHPHISVEGIGLALPCRVDLRTNRLAFAPNPGWEDIDLKAPLEQATGLPVELDNAANACALAEFSSGRHPKSIRNLIAVTVSEDIGVGMIFNGKLVRGTSGVAGEFGHVTIQKNGRLCRCGNRGCLEVYASNTAALRHFRERTSARAGKHAASEPAFDTLLSVAEKGNRIARESLDRIAHSLGAGIALMITGLAPDVVVIVGEVTRAWNRIGPIINRVATERSATGVRSRIAPADADTQPRVRGAIGLVLQKHNYLQLQSAI